MKTDSLAGARKREGDHKTPAGLFRLGAAFGYAPQDEARWIKIPYIALTRDSEGVDDPKSKFYNRIVERAKIDKPDWKSSERMFRDDDLYRWGVVIEHNSDPIVPGAGSCIFLHVWRSPNSATVGCIAMAQSELIPLLKWFDPSAKPVLVAVPKNVYSQLHRDWKLPDLKER
jgi:D-alanyl-D-alanine dipeptidase